MAMAKGGFLEVWKDGFPVSVGMNQPVKMVSMIGGTMAVVTGALQRGLIVYPR